MDGMVTTNSLVVTIGKDRCDMTNPRYFTSSYYPAEPQRFLVHEEWASAKGDQQGKAYRDSTVLTSDDLGRLTHIQPQIVREVSVPPDILKHLSRSPSRHRRVSLATDVHRIDFHG